MNGAQELRLQIARALPYAGNMAGTKRARRRLARGTPAPKPSLSALPTGPVPVMDAPLARAPEPVDVEASASADRSRDRRKRARGR